MITNRNREWDEEERWKQGSQLGVICKNPKKDMTMALCECGSNGEREKWTFSESILNTCG